MIKNYFIKRDNNKKRLAKCLKYNNLKDNIYKQNGKLYNSKVNLYW